MQSLVNRFISMRGIGFDLCAYLRQRKQKPFRIYFNSADWMMLETVVSAFHHDYRVRPLVKNYLSDVKEVFEFSDVGIFGRIQTYDFQSFNIQAGETIIMLSKNPDDKFVRKAVNRKAELIFLEDFIRSIRGYTHFIKPLMNLREQNPEVTYIIIDKHWPMMPETIRSENEETIVGQGITYPQILKALKQDNMIITPGFTGLPYNKPEKLKELLHVIPTSHDADGVLRLNDYSSKLVNARGGIRLTTGNPPKASRSIFITGGCRTYGYGSPDDKTIASYLQQRINACKQDIAVKNCGLFLGKKHYNYPRVIENIPVEPGDIVLLLNGVRTSELKKYGLKLPSINLKDLFCRPHDFGEVFFDLRHYTEHGNKAIADEIFDFLLTGNYLDDGISIEQRKAYEAKTMRSKTQPALENERLKGFLDYLGEQRKPIGSIVMNCNPFTNGHRYLIEQALKECAHLYIFVVQEDRSEFKFKDRMKLVQQGTADLDNLTILPSGEFIISSLTFTDYFDKAEIQEKTIDPSYDVELFGQHIAPALGITARFAGEEPNDKVTLQYNMSMAELLPKYGVQFREIARKEVSKGQVISASRVRELLKAKDFDKIKPLVPKSSYDFLIKKFDGATSK